LRRGPELLKVIERGIRGAVGRNEPPSLSFGLAIVVATGVTSKDRRSRMQSKRVCEAPAALGHLTAVAEGRGCARGRARFRIVALGSSSTAEGRGERGRFTYPSRLDVEAAPRYPDASVGSSNAASMAKTQRGNQAPRVD